ncbi:MAG: SIS domain-containing protein [Candidatus Staskawiczbacteria bacterium]|jgi:D-sedoheptulose 7-phosphate isomerase
MDIKSFAKNYLDETRKILDLMEEDLLNKTEKIANLLEETKNKKNRIFIMGNGGSGSTASHFAEDLSKGTIVEDSLRFKAISLADSMPAILAWANDSGYENIFVEQLKIFMEPDDVVIGISGSGNSKNVIKAIDYANQKGGITIGFSGYDGGELIKRAKINIHVPSFNMQRVEDVHMMVTHLLMSLLLEKEKQNFKKQ